MYRPDFCVSLAFRVFKKLYYLSTVNRNRKGVLKLKLIFQS